MSEPTLQDEKLFYSIKEVAQHLQLSESLLRYWEKEFPQIAPKKGPRGIRYYKKEDIEKIRVIRDLVKGRGLKIAAAREALKQNKQGTVQTVEAVQRLRQIKAELADMKRAVERM